MVGISSKMLIRNYAIWNNTRVARKVYPVVPPKVEYNLDKEVSLSVQL